MENNLQETKEKAKKDHLKTIAVTLSIIFISLLIFSLGVAVGIKKARFSERFGQNYERNFAPEPPGPMGFMRDFEGRGVRNAHGISGTIISVNSNSLVMKDRKNNEISVTINEKTVIKNGPEDLGIQDLKNDQRIVVLGKPQENGSIKADFIRVLKNIDENNNE